MIQLLVKDIEDEKVRENFKRLQKELTSDQVILQGQWKFFELSFDSAVTNYKYPHKLNFTPKDVIQTFVTAGEAVIWNQEEFDRTNLDITTSGPCTVRAFVGTYIQTAGQLG